MNLKDIEQKYRLNNKTISFMVILYSCYLFLLDSIILLICRSRKASTGKINTLVIKLDAIGDFVLWLDFARGLRELYPVQTHNITLMGNIAWIELAHNVPYFDHIVEVDRMKAILNPFYRMCLMWSIRRKGYDIAVDPTFSREFPLSPSIVRTSGAKVRVTPKGDNSNQRPWQKNLSDRWYTNLTPSAKTPMMELSRNAEFLRSLGHRQCLPRVPVLKGVAETAINGSPYYVLFPGAGWVGRQWSPSNFAAIASLIHKTSGWKGVICGSLSEVQLADDIKQLTDAPLENMAGRTTLPQLASVIAGAVFIIGNETSGIHLASAVSTPSVCVLGGGHFSRFVPYDVEGSLSCCVPIPVYYEMECYHCNWHCIHKVTLGEPVPCIANVSVEMVWKELVRLVPSLIN